MVTSAQVGRQIDEATGDRSAEDARPGPGRVLAMVLAAVLYAVGFVLAFALVPVGMAITWALSAVVTGWLDCRDMYAGRGEE
jgi:hypothetical protein